MPDSRVYDGESRVAEWIKPEMSGRVGPVVLTETLTIEYEAMFDSCYLRSDWIERIDRSLDKYVLPNFLRYQEVGRPLGIPWWWIAGAHLRESTSNFSRHLHNGDPLTARTVHVPAGRPVNGHPPYTWEDSAADALRLKKLEQWDDWSIAGSLYQWERYNGFGYRRRGVHSPYLWNGTHFYLKGKYVADGRYDPGFVDAQVGLAALLRRLVDQEVVTVAHRDTGTVGTPNS